MTEYTKTGSDRRFASLEIQRKADKEAKKGTNLRQELDTRLARVTAGDIMEHSDVALALYERCELRLLTIEDTLNKTDDLSLFKSGKLEGRRAETKDMQNFILAKINQGDIAKVEIAREAQKETLLQEKKKADAEIDDAFDKVDELLEEET